MNGILNILKPPGMTSHDVVSVVRKKLNMKKVGHTGTLDPNAAGVLPICVGQATKISNYLLDSGKTYRGELTLGVETDTQDQYGAVLRTKEVNVSQDEIRDVFSQFIGTYEQMPPMYSALKVQGKKLYELAREGLEVERKPRKITIYSLDIIHIEKNRVLFDVSCSKGTYIRTLCKDIGDRLGCGGMMSFLLRTQSSVFTIQSALPIEELMSREKNAIELYPIDYPLSHIPAVSVRKEKEKAALNGNPIAISDLLQWDHLPSGSEVRVYIGSQLIGIGLVKEDNRHQPYIKFARIFA